MSLLSHLNETFERLSTSHSDLITDSSPLCPCYHVFQNVEVCVTITEDGLFRDARFFTEPLSEVKKGKEPKPKAKKLPIPVTSDSASRTSGASPHPLVDCLQYLAPDFPDYSKKGKGNYEEYHELLESWCNCEFAHPKVKAVLRYIEKGTLLQDLMNKELLEIDSETGNLKNEKLFVAWKVLGNPDSTEGEVEGPDKQELWRNKEVFDSWIDFYGAEHSVEGLCIVSGEEMPLADKHPKKILSSNANAKLISANDMSGFTFRGRFTDTKDSISRAGYQAANIGEKVTQQAHSALGWLLQNRGRMRDGQAVIAWSTSGQKIPQPEQSVLDLYLYGGDEHEAESDESEVTSDLTDELEPGNKPEYEDTAKLGKAYSSKLHSLMAGYYSEISHDDRISVLTLESAVPGRLAATYYVESMPKSYLESIELWYEQFSFPRVLKDDNNHLTVRINTPRPDEIFKCAYGEKNDTEGLKRRTRAQIISVIVEGARRNIQEKLMHNCFQRACRPLGQDRARWPRNLWIACCLYRGFELRRNINKGSLDMALNPEYTGRDYLFGRLLAIADNIEGYSLKKSDEKRATTAMRYLQQFSTRPSKTWENIEKALTPHLNRLRTRAPGFHHKRTQLLDEVMSKFEQVSDFSSDKALGPEFLLGFHSQRLALMHIASDETQQEEVSN